MPNNSTANANGNGQAEDSSRDVDDVDRTTNSSGSSKRRRRSITNENDDDESKAKVDKDTDEQHQQQAAKEQEDKGDNIQLGQKTPIRTKTYDGGSTSTSQDATDDSNRSTNDPWPRDCNGRRRTRLSTEQHVSTFLDNLNLNGEG